MNKRIKQAIKAYRAEEIRHRDIRKTIAGLQQLIDSTVNQIADLEARRVSEDKRRDLFKELHDPIMEE